MNSWRLTQRLVLNRCRLFVQAGLDCAWKTQSPAAMLDAGHAAATGAAAPAAEPSGAGAADAAAAAKGDHAADEAAADAEQEADEDADATPDADLMTRAPAAKTAAAIKNSCRVREAATGSAALCKSRLHAAAAGNLGQSSRPKHRHSHWWFPSLRPQVEGCSRSLLKEKNYFRRYRCCKEHSRAAVVVIDGAEKRFCQQVPSLDKSAGSDLFLQKTSLLAFMSH